MNYFDELGSLLKSEQEYDYAEHEALLLKSSLQERRNQGVTWFPIAISNSEMGRGDYLTVTVQKTNFPEDGHKFRFGMPVSLFSNYDASEDRIDGIIAFVSRDTMRIAFRVDELPDWSRRGKLGVDLLFDENSYREMFDALKQAKELYQDQKNGALVRQLVGEEALAIVRTEDSFYHNAELNDSQNQAIALMLSEHALAILHGPPGTGKTTTLIRGVQALLKQEKRQILLVAPSNTAVDILTERLDTLGINVVRIGNSVRVSSHLQGLTLDGKAEQHGANKECKALEKQARAYTEMAHKYKRSFGKSEREQRKALFDEARKIRKEIDKIQDYVVSDILDKAEVITATLVGANHYTVRDRNYKTVIIDEAAQALEPACWIPILKAERLILAGDHCQLSPTVKSSHKPQEGLYNTLFEKLVVKYPQAVTLLDVQYRMNEQIMHYPSLRLYDGKLAASTTVANWTLRDDDQPIQFIDTAGAGYEETVEDGGIFNVDEANFLRLHLLTSLKKINTQYDINSLPTVGVIAPYRKQAHLLKEILLTEEWLKESNYPLQTHTIDSFQGQEKDIIYISLTRSNGDQQIGFLADIRRMNVAMTRAKKKLVVIGDSATIGQNDFYKGFLDYVTSVGGYHSVWEWDLENIF